ncbi:MAG: TIGR00730 family Rossman fold protein [Acidimicrobiales bacterium]
MSGPIEEFLRELDTQTHQSPERREILRGLVTRIVELAQLDADTADLRIASTALNELLEASALFAAWRDKAKVTVFGSARTKPDDPLYEMARAFGAASAARGWMTVSGAGPGIMEASSKGSGKDNTLGVNIELPFEQGANEFIDVDEMHVAMKFFFTRKVAMTRASHAFVAFPGGVGTMDELFEILTLVHTGKTDPAPIVLVETPDGTFWERWCHFVDVLVHDGYIDALDTCLFRVCTSVVSAMEEIEHFYRNYRSLQVEPGRARIALHRVPNATQCEELAARFPVFSSARGFRVEDNQLTFDFDGRNYVRLRLLIDALNDLAG